MRPHSRLSPSCRVEENPLPSSSFSGPTFSVSTYGLSASEGSLVWPHAFWPRLVLRQDAQAVDKGEFKEDAYEPWRSCDGTELPR